MKITNIKLFPNNNEKAREIEKKLIKIIENNNLSLVEEDYDLAVAVGGDGSFLRMVKENDFNSDIFYVGVNAGTLGFLQDITVEEFDGFIKNIKVGNFKYDNIGVQETYVYNDDNQMKKYYSLNEIVIRDKDLNVCKLSIKLDNEELEYFVGDGILVSTSTGSTAYNMSFGGSIVYNTLHTLQITPMAPLNSKSYRDLMCSVVVPENKEIEIIPDNKSILLSVDGENYEESNVKKIATIVDKKRIKCIRPNNYYFSKKIKDKFLK